MTVLGKGGGLAVPDFWSSVLCMSPVSASLVCGIRSWGGAPDIWNGGGGETGLFYFRGLGYKGGHRGLCSWSTCNEPLLN